MTWISRRTAQRMATYRAALDTIPANRTGHSRQSLASGALISVGHLAVVGVWIAERPDTGLAGVGDRSIGMIWAYGLFPDCGAVR
jgi:hypothetical protein